MTPTPEGKQLAADLANAEGMASYHADHFCIEKTSPTGAQLALARLATERLALKVDRDLWKRSEAAACEQYDKLLGKNNALKAQLEEALADLREIDRQCVGQDEMWDDTGPKIATIAAKYRVETDPLLIVARELVAARYNPDHAMECIEATLRGEDDYTDAVQNCLAALKRGYEIGRKS